MVTCITCNCRMRPLKNGALIQENFEDGTPYKVWMADTYRCEKCGAVVATGFPLKPLWERFEGSAAMPTEPIAGRF